MGILLSDKIFTYPHKSLFTKGVGSLRLLQDYIMANSSNSSRTKNLEQELEKKLVEIGQKGRKEEAAKQAQHIGIPFSDLKNVSIDNEALGILDESIAKSARMAVLYRSGSSLIVAIIDPDSTATKESLELLAKQGFSVKTLMTTPEAMASVLKRYETLKEATLFETGAIEIDTEKLDALSKQINTLSDLRNKISFISATELLEILIAGALKTSASDIHFEPEAKGVRLRYRLDGLLHDVVTFDSQLYLKALSRIKVLSKLKLNVHNTPQDGRFTIKQQEVAIEVRVSVLPSEHGETVVMRLLDPRTIVSKLEDLGMRPDILGQVEELLKKPNGTLLTTGPTGSGKTSTLYAFVNRLNTPDTKIITIEDPIEYHIKGISQTQVEPSKNYTFANGLRAIVRQDPDVILVGEIRDFETADIALNAALTGHLVLSTLHTNDAAGTIPRLIDLGIKPETIAPAISLAMAQRLLRRLCPKCKKKSTLPSDELAKVHNAMEPLRKQFSLPPIDEKLAVYSAGTCKECDETGYKSRAGVFEIFTVTRAMEKLILSRAPSVSDIKELAISEGMVTMLQDGYLKLIEGVTSIEEVRRVLG